MIERKGKDIIGHLQKRWTLIAVLCDLMLAATGLIAVSVLIRKWISPGSVWLEPMICVVALLILVVLRRFRKPDAANIARYLNRQIPQLEESAHLLLKPPASRNLLEQLQAARVEQAIHQHKLPSFHNKRVLQTVLIAGLSIPLIWMIYILQVEQFFRPQQADRSSTYSTPLVPEKKPAGISSLRLKIIPPAYMGLRATEQPDFAIRSAEGSEVIWQIESSEPVQRLSLLFNGKDSVALQSADTSHTVWSVRKKLLTAGFYQVKLNGKLSEMYMIDLVKDRPPVIRILSPKQYTTIDFGQPQQVPLRAQVTDDYGVSSAFITATIASGSGEAVKFREQRMPFPGFAAGRTQTAAQRTLDLRQLGMNPGDELYYYITALDNHRQENRSDVYIISLPDTAQIMEIEGMANGVNLKPDYFRSQRQIIIDTEQLLKDRDTITTDQFNARSNNLGMDQKLLRLRYGKFLGEESENEIGGHADHDEEEGHDEVVFGDATKMLDEMTHKHDNSEDATFFEPKLKAQLKATLNEMWKSELQLRLHKPQPALPFEYKALRLLKDLQQQSRSYVAKTSYKTTPLRPEKRLSADLSKINQPTNMQTVLPKNEPEQTVRRAAGLLEELKAGILLSAPSQKILQAAAYHLGNMAIAKPAVYLSSFKAIKVVLAGLAQPATIRAADINAAEKGLQLMIADIGKQPRPAQAGNQPLSQQYFKNLMQTNRHP